MERLRRRRDFLRACHEGRPFRSAHLAIHALAREKTPPRGLRVGFSVGRRFGGAVARNRLRRRLREACRTVVSKNLKPIRGDWDLIIIPRPEAARARFQELSAGLRDILERLPPQGEQEAP
jgi:ribonuclease P protein component